tara:strand:- start:79 stop:480 length:402 start_codon:yes stop_codon:yes gene_type:complete
MNKILSEIFKAFKAGEICIPTREIAKATPKNLNRAEKGLGDRRITMLIPGQEKGITFFLSWSLDRRAPEGKGSFAGSIRCRFKRDGEGVYTFSPLNEDNAKKALAKGFLEEGKKAFKALQVPCRVEESERITL